MPAAHGGNTPVIAEAVIQGLVLKHGEDPKVQNSVLRFLQKDLQKWNDLSRIEAISDEIAMKICFRFDHTLGLAASAVKAGHSDFAEALGKQASRYLEAYADTVRKPIPPGEASEYVDQLLTKLRERISRTEASELGKKFGAVADGDGDKKQKIALPPWMSGPSMEL